MTNEIRRLVDLDEQALARVPFGRNRFLRALGIALFGSVVRLLLPQITQAHHQDPPYPCFGYHKCSCCSGTSCCTASGCGYWESLGCPGGGQCWYTCGVEGYLYKCCDWRQRLPDGSWDPNPCICSGWVGYC